jgi:hypothetical protein
MARASYQSTYETIAPPPPGKALPEVAVFQKSVSGILSRSDCRMFY